MDSYKDLMMKLGRQDKAKYNPWCLKGKSVPKAVDFASQIDHFGQLTRGNSNKMSAVGACEHP